jgi:hypothetical protein
MMSAVHQDVDERLRQVTPTLCRCDPTIPRMRAISSVGRVARRRRLVDQPVHVCLGAGGAASGKDGPSALCSTSCGTKPWSQAYWWPPEPSGRGGTDPAERRNHEPVVEAWHRVVVRGNLPQRDRTRPAQIARLIARLRLSVACGSGRSASPTRPWRVRCMRRPTSMPTVNWYVRRWPRSPPTKVDLLVDRLRRRLRSGSGIGRHGGCQPVVAAHGGVTAANKPTARPHYPRPVEERRSSSTGRSARRC